MLDSSRALFLLAHQFTSQNAYQEAAKCLQAICNQRTELPSVLAQARLQLGRLLLEHFDNVKEARKLLLTAKQDLRQSQSHHLLKCEVQDALACCLRQLGAVDAERVALQDGLKASRLGPASKDKEVLSKWQVYFLFRLAEYGMIHSGPGSAADGLDQLEAAASGMLSDAERALYLLCRATVALCSHELSAVAQLMEQLGALMDTEGQWSDALLHRHLRCHYNLLYVAMAVAAGRIAELKQDSGGAILLLASTQELIRAEPGAPWSYAWLPTPAVAALAAILHSSLLRTLGKAAAAQAQLAAALEVVEHQLKQQGLDLQGSEVHLSTRAIWAGRPYCHLRMLAAEQQVLAALASSRYSRARDLLGWMTGVLSRFPRLLADFVPGAHLLLGHYAHALQQYAAASTHFQAVLSSDAPHLHDSAAVAGALAALQAEAGPAGVHAAMALLKERGLDELAHVLALPIHDRTSALLVNALAACRTGDEGNARVILTKALKQAHAQLGNTQMVAQVLNVLAPIQAGKGDFAGAEQMLSSALTLSKAQGDLPALLTASRALEDLFRGSPAHAEQAAKQQAYGQRKAGDLRAAVEQAAAPPAHAALLAWAPETQLA